MFGKKLTIGAMAVFALAAGVLIRSSRPPAPQMPPEAAVPAPPQETRLKQASLSRDLEATSRLCRLDADRDLTALLNQSGDRKRLAASSEALLRTHRHIALLQWYDLGGRQDELYKPRVPGGGERELRLMRSYLSAGRKAASAGRAYESPSFSISGRQYFVMARASENRKFGAVALFSQKVLERVSDHQRKNLRLVPYPKEGSYRMESVHADTLRELTVRTGHDNEQASHYYENEIVVRFRNNAPSAAELQRIAGDIQCGTPRKLGYAYIFKSRKMRYPELKQYFADRWNPAYMEPHYIYLTNETEGEQAVPAAPNDRFFAEYQWNLPAIETERGWSLTRGSKDVIVAVVDTGVQADHPDLRGQLLTGYNAVGGGKAEPFDDVGHGTHVAGVIGALVNNAEGVAGISWYNKILPVKALDATGVGTTYTVAEGIIWATDHGAKVINLSLGNYADSDFLHDAIRYAYDRDVVLVSAAGNDNTERPGFPAAYPEVFAVAATNASGEKASFSNYGDYIDVAAPGEAIASTYPDNQYAALSGTSMASPHVSALAGLIRSLNPELTNTEVMELMRGSTVDLGDPGYDPYFGWGQIDIYRALQAAGGGDTPLQLYPQHVAERMENLRLQLNKKNK